MEWNQLNSPEQLNAIVSESENEKIVIFKHSTRCSISSMALNRLERSWEKDVALKPYYLDLIANRGISNDIASRFGVEHASPQVLVIENGQCVYHTSHMGINFQELKDLV
ncbi:bacillithiol system redox-active protein YtxJ [Sediminitomix flava]|uniref:Bacillithiol system protein YtxJ n=1 Tax=Sediminitomix flava TaxID=379075 RepID=A0A315ZJ91_SEDFL|nr:bacillithiol system redox-active protein YtxJ [Sediminitomix flava]PWJ44908.1 bacillithiol system protein YtxJ [Sediminitomix flava]